MYVKYVLIESKTGGSGNPDRRSSVWMGHR